MPSLSTEQVCVTIHQHMQNMEKSLRCPLCLSCCTDPTMISNCCHTFCGPCIRRGLKDKRECPSCKQACSRRSLLPAPHFDELVHAYKKMLVNFGLAPSRFDPSVAVTQIAPDSNDYSSDEEEENDNDNDDGSNCIIEEEIDIEDEETKPSVSLKTKKEKQLDWMEVHEQVQAARTFQKYLGELNNNIQKDQEAIVQINERALLKAAVQRQKRGQPPSQTDSTSLSQLNREYAVEQQAADHLLLPVEESPARPATSYDQSDDTSADDAKLPAREVAFAQESQDHSFHSAARNMLEPPSEDSQTSFYSAQQSEEEERPSQSPSSTRRISSFLDKENVSNATDVTPMANNKRGEGDRKQKSVVFASAVSSISSQKTSALQTLSQTKGHELPSSSRIPEVSSGTPVETCEENSEDMLMDQKMAAVQKDSPIATASPRVDRGENSEEALMDQKMAAVQKDSLIATASPRMDQSPLDPTAHESTCPQDQLDTRNKPSTDSSSANSNETPTSVSRNEGPSTSESDDQPMECVDERATTEPKSASPSTNAFSVGTIVEVQSRTWPGVNKLGGVGRVTRVHTSPSVRYDIAYVLGGREKLVDAVFVSSNDRDLGRQKDVGSIRLRDTGIPKALLEDLAKEGFDTVGAPTEEVFRGAKKKKTLFTRASRKRTKEDPPEAAPLRTKKPRTIRSVVNAGVNMLRSKKKREETKPMKEDERMSDVALCRLADEHYNQQLESIFKKGTVLHVMATGLSPDQMDQLHHMKQNLKKPVSIKTCDTFSKKVQMCIVSSELQGQDPANLVSRSRTMKALRSLLKGIPIVSTRWLHSCFEAKKVLKPDPFMFVRTLPARNGSNITDFGVAKQCALIQQNSRHKPLAAVSLHLCGKFSRDLESHLLLLAKESGVKAIVNRQSAAAKIRSLPEEGIMVLLCNDDSGFNVSTAIKREVEKAPKKIVVASVQWLFDTVCSTEFQDARTYPPESKDLRQLWSLTTERTGEGAYLETTNL